MTPPDRSALLAEMRSRALRGLLPLIGALGFVVLVMAALASAQGVR